MKNATHLLRLLLVLPLALPSSCVTSDAAFSESGEPHESPSMVRATWLSEEHLQLEFEPLPSVFDSGLMSEEEALRVLTAFAQSFPENSQLEVIPAMTASSGRIAPWEQKLRAEFLKRYGPARLPLPDSLLNSPLFMALRMSPRYMGPGIRDAAQQLFRSPSFLASVALSVLVYFAAWTLPEPLFSKAFAATLTVRLAFLVGMMELRNIAPTCLRLYREAQAARSMKELEAVAERFGRALGGTALRVLITVASFGVARALPNVPSGGLGSLVGPPRYAMAGGLSAPSAHSAHVVADGILVLMGAALGMAGSGATNTCTDGSSKQKGYQWHHLATNKNELSATRGGPWTPLFDRLFAKAGMSLDDPANRVHSRLPPSSAPHEVLKGHRGHMTRYYELLDDRRAPGRWHLGPPLDERGRKIDPWQFKEGRTLELEGIPRLLLDAPGRPLDFCWAAFSIPVVHERFARTFEPLRLKEVQLIPAQVEGHSEPWYILNALQIIRCIDDARGGAVQYWEPEDNQPDKLGEYRAVHQLRIDPAKVGDARIFRPWGWRVALIISEDIKKAIEASGLSGTRFIEV